MKGKADNSHGREKYEITESHKSYDDYAFPNDKICHPRCENKAGSVLCSPTNDENKFPNKKFVLLKCNTCTYFDLPGVKRDSSNRAPVIF